MQYPFSLMPATYTAVEATLSPARLGRYLPAAQGDRQLALRLYIWNARLCESLYLPFQFAEVAARNAIHKPVGKRFGTTWYTDPKFINILSDRMKGELNDTVRGEKKKRKLALNQDHIIAGLSFGFWVALMTSSYDNHLWLNGTKSSFQYASKLDDREAIYDRLDKMRKFRNDIAHHIAIFDRSPQTQLQNAQYITGLICKDTLWLSKELSRVSQVINQRPK